MNDDQDYSDDMEASINAVSVMVFRINSRWLAIPTTLVRLVAELTVPHSIPGKTNSCFLGIVNAGGELTLCFSLAELLGITVHFEETPKGKGRPRLIVVGNVENRFAFAVDDVAGVHAVSVEDWESVTQGLFPSDRLEPVQIIVGDGLAAEVLNAQTLWHALNRSLSYDAG
ncbi:MAG: chemotaxis protein CheW [Syntrophaceae bacterium]|nr:chemotaxis protein CheW [Syntrophaceae bacterium]